MSRKRTRRDRNRPAAERIAEYIFLDFLEDASGMLDDPDVRRAIERLEAVGGAMFETRPVAAEDVQPGAITIPGDMGTVELVTRITVWGVDTSVRGQPDPRNPGCVLLGRPTARWEWDQTRPVGGDNPPRLVGAYATLDLDERGQVVHLDYHFPGLDEGDKPHVERAVRAVLDELARQGRPERSGATFPTADSLILATEEAITSLRAQNLSITVSAIAEYLAHPDNPRLGLGDPVRQFQRAAKKHGFPSARMLLDMLLGRNQG